MGGLAVARVIKFQRPAPLSAQDPWQAFDWNAAAFWHSQLPECMAHARADGLTPDDLAAVIFDRPEEGQPRVPYAIFGSLAGAQRIFGPGGQVACLA
ncbi:hypothetical protein CSW63_05055 [Caulobacter sp. FWC26]|nr:hypothetical protein CSW63_05055 [Caulobacter sp. FWC26]